MTRQSLRDAFVIIFVAGWAVLEGLPAGSALASRPGVGFANPTNYVSPSGTYSLFVNPGDRYGYGGALYHLMKNGQEVWAGEKPYTLRDVVVTNKGQIAGFAYRMVKKEAEAEDTASATGWPSDPPQYFHIVILDSAGREVLNDVKPRFERHDMSHAPPAKPYLEQLIIDPPNNRLLARVVARVAEWWIYRLSDGKPLERFAIDDKVPDKKKVCYVLDARVLPGTPLMLLHWYVRSPDYEVKDRSGRFTLLDGDYRPVWSFDGANDYNDIDWYRPGGGGPADYFEDHPAIVRADQPNRFDLRLFAENKQVSFAVSRDEDGQYAVRELGRVEFVESPPPETVFVTDTDRPVPFLGELALGATGAAPYRQIVGFTFGADGYIYATRRTKGNASTLLQVNCETGEVVSERPYPAGVSWPSPFWKDMPRLRAEDFLVMRSSGDHPKVYSLWSVKLATEAESQIDLSFGPGGYARGISRFPDGGLAVLETYTYRNSPQTRLTRYDAELRPRWKIDSQDRQAEEILGQVAGDVTVTSTGNIALLAGNVLHFLDPDGKPSARSDLKDVYGSYPGYIREIVADADGGCILEVSGKPDGIVRFNADGTVRRRFSARHPDGKTFDTRAGIRVDLQGRLWTSDGEAFMRLTDEGVVDRFLGERPQMDRLDRVIAFTADRRGRLYAVASGTGAVHVFDRSGKLLHICKPAEDDFDRSVTHASLVVTDEGEVYLQRNEEYLHFSSTGERLGIATFEPKLEHSPVMKWAFQPGTGNRCGFRSTELLIVDREGNILRSISKRPENKWLSYSNTMVLGPDGTSACLVSDTVNGVRQDAVDLYAANGDPLRTIPLPRPTKHYIGIAFGENRIVVVGQHEVVVVDPDDDSLKRWALNVPNPERGYLIPFIMPGGDELLLYERNSHKVYRYELPSRASATAEEDVGSTVRVEERLDTHDAEAQSPWVKKYLEVVSGLPEPGPCVVYAQKIEGGEQTLTEAQARELPEEERAQLRELYAGECESGFDHPRVYGRMLDILAGAGVEQVEGMKVLDYGCCDVRNLRALARLGAQVVGVQSNISLQSMCEKWDDLGEVEGPEGQQGHLKVIRFGCVQPDTAGETLGAGYDLITLRNVLQLPPAEDYFSPETWLNTGLAQNKAEFAEALFGLLEPGGYVLGYSLGVGPFAVESAIERSLWAGAGFEVVAFDRDDRGAALGIGKELVWDRMATPLGKMIRAKYSLFRKP